MSGPVIIVGYGEGVAAATARAFAALGHPVALLARNAQAVGAAAAGMTQAGARAQGFAADASDEASLLAALEAAQAALGIPAVLVYNAAFWRPGPVLSLTASNFEQDYRTCVVGAFVAAQWAAARMRPAGVGSILMTGGGLALYPSPMAPTLAIGKAGIRALALMLAEELVPTGLRVGTVTIAGTVGPDGIPPERVADAFLQLHATPPDRASAELVLKP